MTTVLPSKKIKTCVPPLGREGPCERLTTRTVVSRTTMGDRSKFKLSDGEILDERRFLPLGKGDVVTGQGESLAVLAKRDDDWIGIGTAWSRTSTIDLRGIELPITFKEVETEAELRLFQQLRQFHYRGGGGIGRTLPLIGMVDTPDLPRVIGFVELTSAMIANTARKRFFDGPYREANGLGWSSWDRSTSRELSALVCRISRFVIHPELRGVGLARSFASAAIEFAEARWHYGGYRPRFLEITADMLRYYPFVGDDFTLIGETEGNEHRVSKDMSYLVKRALSADGVRAMPQGGGGIMSLQRGYATTLLKYIQETGSSLEEAVAQLQYDPSKLSQLSWEKLHRLNRRPKPCYVAGIGATARAFISKRATQLSIHTKAVGQRSRSSDYAWNIGGLGVYVETDIIQTKQGRLLQDAFGFVGRGIKSTVVHPVDMTIRTGQVTLVCGASGSGKSLFLSAVIDALSGGGLAAGIPSPNGVRLFGCVDRPGRIATLQPLDPLKTPIELIGTSSLDKLLMMAARCGLAEPQLLVRPICTLSSGQQYRLQITIALLQDPEIIIVDNFCESLDRFSTRAVCKGIVTLARELNIAAVLATAAYDRLQECLSPDQVVMLRRGDDTVVRKAVPLEI